jgi:hypothetical protein
VNTPTVDQTKVADQYVPLLDLLMANIRVVQLLPLAEMADVNEQMQALGPVLDPTRYRDGGGRNLHDQRRIIDAALALRNVLDDITNRSDL